MSDVRHINFQRVRRWGYATAIFGKITGDDTYDTLFAVSEDFSVTEQSDEETGLEVFEFRIYSPELYDEDLVKSADVIIFAGRKYERETHELKQQDPAHWKFTAVPVGVG